jgi:hypothetical protein
MASSRAKNRLAVSIRRVGMTFSINGRDFIAAQGRPASRIWPLTWRRSPIDSTSITSPVRNATRTTPLRHQRTAVNRTTATSGAPR